MVCECVGWGRSEHGPEKGVAEQHYTNSTKLHPQYTFIIALSLL